MPIALTQPAALPWSWFDFDDHPRVLDGRGVEGGLADVESGGGDCSYAVRCDGRVIPFKYFRKGSGGRRPVVMLQHGMGLTIATFRGVARYLFETHDLVLIDYSSLSCHPRPHGWPHGGLPIRALADSVWPIADAVGVERFSIGGNSLGGGLCLIAAVHANAKGRLEKLVLSNPACYPQELPKMYRYLRVPLLGELLMAMTQPEKLIGGVEYIGYVDKTAFDPDLRQRYLRNMGHWQNRFRLMELIRHLPANERDLTPAIHLSRLGDISQPVLLTWGEQDPLLVKGAGERLARELPNCKYEPQGDLAHMPHEEAPERVGRRWAEFLGE